MFPIPPSRFALISDSDVPLYDPLTFYQQLMHEPLSRVRACCEFHGPWLFHGALFLLSFDRVAQARAVGHRRGLMSCRPLLACAMAPLGAAGNCFPLLLPVPASLHPSGWNVCTRHLQVRACASGWMNRDRWRDEMSVSNQLGGGTSSPW